MSIIDNGQVLGSFQGVSSAVPLVGIILNEYEGFGNLGQYKYNPTNMGGNPIMPGRPVKVINQIGAETSTAGIDCLNSVTGEITARARAMVDLSGFLAMSNTNTVPLAGGEAVPVVGLLVKVATLGSGLKMWLKVVDSDTSLQGVNINIPLTYDFTSGTGGVKAAGLKDAVLPGVLHSTLTDAKVMNFDDSTGITSWIPCKAVLVELIGGVINYVIEEPK